MDNPLKWHIDECEGLVIEIPEILPAEENRPCKQAYTFRIEGVPSKRVCPMAI